MKPIVRAAAQLRATGSYLCPHLEVKKIDGKSGQKSGCCGNDKLDQFVPICSLINGACPGLTHCVRLDIQTKSELIRKWRSNLQKKIQVNPLEYIK